MLCIAVSLSLPAWSLPSFAPPMLTSQLLALILKQTAILQATYEDMMCYAVTQYAVASPRCTLRSPASQTTTCLTKCAKCHFSVARPNAAGPELRSQAVLVNPDLHGGLLVTDWRKAS